MMMLLLLLLRPHRRDLHLTRDSLWVVLEKFLLPISLHQ